MFCKNGAYTSPRPNYILRNTKIQCFQDAVCQWQTGKGGHGGGNEKERREDPHLFQEDVAREAEIRQRAQPREDGRHHEHDHLDL